MSRRARNHIGELRGASRLAIEATKSVTALVEAMHRTIAGGPDLLGRPLAGPARLLTNVVYGSIRGVTHLVGVSIDAALAQLEPLLTPWLAGSTAGPEREAVIAVLNGVLGDYLSETGNPLAITMRLRAGGQALTLERDALRQALPGAGGKLLVLVHGSCMSDRQWLQQGHDHGAALARDLGYTPVYLHYNSGLHVSTNGRAFAQLLEQLVAAWPVPLERFSIVGHSMGGLVARSACHVAETAGHAWLGRLDDLVCVGSPHHGAPLERGGNWIDVLLGASRYSAPLASLGKIRSAGVTDLRFGSVLDEHWDGRDRFERHADPRGPLPLPGGVRCYAIAGTLTPGEGPRLRGDGLVPVDSALGRHRKPELTLAFPEDHTWIARGIGHIGLLHRPEVYETLKAWLTSPRG